jgi:hypothetical protein
MDDMMIQDELHINMTYLLQLCKFYQIAGLADKAHSEKRGELLPPHKSGVLNNELLGA